jgi:hypothetical protein
LLSFSYANYFFKTGDKRAKMMIKKCKGNKIDDKEAKMVIRKQK